MTVFVYLESQAHRTFSEPNWLGVWLLIIHASRHSCFRLVIFEGNIEGVIISRVEQLSVESCCGTILSVCAKFDQLLIDFGHDRVADGVLSFYFDHVFTVDQKVAADHRQVRVPMLEIWHWLRIQGLELHGVSYIVNINCLGDSNLDRNNFTLTLKMAYS